MANKKTISESELVKYSDACKGICMSKDDLMNMVTNLGEKEVKDILYGLIINFTTGKDCDIGNGSKKILYNTMLTKQRHCIERFLVKKTPIQKTFDMPNFN